RITKDFCEHKAGDTKVIRAFDDSDNVFSVGFNELDGRSGGWGNYDIIEKVTDEKVKFAKIGRKPGEFKKGDIVKTRIYGIVEITDVDDSNEWKYEYRDYRGRTERLQRGANLTLIAP